MSDPGVPGWGNADAGSIETIVNRQALFAHELGHLLLPGDDHVNDALCPNNNLLVQIDTNYPDYANTNRTSGIGEFGIDLGTLPWALFGPDSPDIMSYCNRTWISPYNYNRAMTGTVLWYRTAAASAEWAGDQKLLVSFRVYRDGRVEFKSGMHMPGEPRSFPGKASTGVFLEQYAANGELLASTECLHRSPDRLKTAPWEDFQEVLPWFEQTQDIAVIREGQEADRWQIEDPPIQSLASNFTYSRQVQQSGEPVFRLSWDARQVEKQPTYALRFTPDGGATWLALTVGLQETHLEVQESSLPPGDTCRFQLLVSTGIRTVVQESEEFSLAKRRRQIAILRSQAGG